MQTVFFGTLNRVFPVSPWKNGSAAWVSAVRSEESGTVYISTVCLPSFRPFYGHTPRKFPVPVRLSGRQPCASSHIKLGHSTTFPLKKQVFFRFFLPYFHEVTFCLHFQTLESGEKTRGPGRVTLFSTDLQGFFQNL